MILYGYTIFKILKLFTSDNHNVTECVIKWNLAIVVYEKKIWYPMVPNSFCVKSKCPF